MSFLRENWRKQERKMVRLKAVVEKARSVLEEGLRDRMSKMVVVPLSLVEAEIELFKLVIEADTFIKLMEPHRVKYLFPCTNFVRGDFGSDSSESEEDSEDGGELEKKVISALLALKEKQVTSTPKPTIPSKQPTKVNPFRIPSLPFKK